MEIEFVRLSRGITTAINETIGTTDKKGHVARQDLIVVTLLPRGRGTCSLLLQFATKHEARPYLSNMQLASRRCNAGKILFLPVQMPVSLPVQALADSNTTLVVWGHISSAPVVVAKARGIAPE